MDLSQLKNRIDYRRLAGVSRVLGISLEKDAVSLVELKRVGLPWDTHSGRIKAVQSFRLDTSGKEGASSDLKRLLTDHKILSRHAVVALTGARYVSTGVPQDIDNVDEWIEENAAKLLSLPIAPNDLVFRTQHIDTNGVPSQILITFQRQKEIEKAVHFVEDAGLVLLGITSAYPELLRVALLASPHAHDDQIQIIHVSPGTLTSVQCRNKQVVAIESLPRSGETSVDIAAFAPKDNALPTFVVGSLSGYSGAANILKPLGLESEFALPAGAAINGLLPSPREMDFLPVPQTTIREIHLSKRFLQRTGFSLGLLILLLLAIPMGISFWIESEDEKVESALNATGTDQAEIVALEKQVSILRQNVGGNETSQLRSHLAIVLHRIAESTPDGVELSSLSYDPIVRNVIVKGKSDSQDKVSMLMKNLSALGCLDVSLRRLEIHRQVAFEISGTLVPGETL